MQLIKNSAFMGSIAAETTAPRPICYSSHQIVKNVSKYNNLKCETIEIQVNSERNYFKFNVHYISNKNKGDKQQPCIVYLHGLSSYCFQGLYLLPYINNSFSLCIYDLRGHGKNQKQHVTYGIKQAQDLYYLLKKLIQMGNGQIYLWGRSMGAATILYFMKHYQKEQEVIRVVKSVVLDSPFSSFQKITKETVAKQWHIPKIFSVPFVQALFNKIYENEKVNLRVLNFKKFGQAYCPAIFVYSQQDQVIDCSHIKKIGQGYEGKQEMITGQFNHNDQRPYSVITKIIRCLPNSQQHNVSKYQSAKKGISLINSNIKINIETGLGQSQNKQHRKIKISYRKSQPVFAIDANYNINLNQNQNMSPQNSQSGDKSISMSIKNKLKKSGKFINNKGGNASVNANISMGMSRKNSIYFYSLRNQERQK